MTWTNHEPREISCQLAQCGASFRSANPNARFCSVAHRDMHRRAAASYRAAQRKYFATEHGKRARAVGMVAHRERFPEREAARAAVKNAIKRGELIRRPCRDCGDPNTEAHHPDYSKPFEVVWLCKPHHRIEDRKRRAA
jgi:hypothetical protein